MSNKQKGGRGEDDEPLDIYWTSLPEAKHDAHPGRALKNQDVAEPHPRP